MTGVQTCALPIFEMYLGQKNLKLTEELDRCIETLYQKNVPSNVREFIEMTTAKKPARKSKNNAHDELNIQSE